MLETSTNGSRAGEVSTFTGEVAPNGFERTGGDGTGKKRGGRLAMRHMALGVCVALLLAAWPVSSYSQRALTTVAVGTNPVPVVLNPVTNRIYVASFQDGAVKVIDGATGTVISTVTVASPGAIAVNATTNMIYVADTSANTVTVIDGATNTAGTPITVGTTPIALAVNPLTNMIYVGNQVSNNVSVIDGSSNTVIATLLTGANPQVIGVNPVTNLIYVVNNAAATVSVIDGAGNPQNVVATVAVGTNPLSIGVNPFTGLIYVANSGSNSVTVIDGSINTTASTVTVPTGAQPRVLTVNPASNLIYVANHNAGTVTVIDGFLNTTMTVAVGSAPISLAVNPTTNQIYVANHTGSSGGGTLSVIDGSLNTTASVVTVPFASGAFPSSLAVNPVTNQVYAADQSSNDLTIFDGATDLTATVTVGSSGQQNGTSIVANPATNKIYVPNSFTSTVTVIDGVTNGTTTISSLIGMTPNNAAVNVVTNKIYVTNLGDHTVSVIDGSTDTVSDVVTVGSSSQVNRTSIAANPVTNKIYVPNSFSNTVTVIDGSDDSTTTITTGIGMLPNAVAINPVTNKIYVTNLGDHTVSVIDGNSNTVSAVVTVGSSSQANGSSIAVNPATNKIYVPNSFSNTVTVINGATNATTTISTLIGSIPNNLAINPVTNKIYVTNLGDQTVSVIDGATDTVSAVVTVGSSSQANRTSIAVNPVTNKIYVPNSFTNTVTVIDGATNTTSTVTPGTDPNALAINLATNNIYVTNLGGGTVTVISEEQVQTMPLVTSIDPIPGNVTTTATPTFTFTATNSAGPVGSLVPGKVRMTAKPLFINTPAIPTTPGGLVAQVYYQVDTWEGPWIATSPGCGDFSATVTSPLRQGTHVVYAYATDGEESHSTGLTQQLVGQMAAEVFTVILPGTTTDLSADNNPAAVGQAVTFTAGVSSTTAGAITGTVTFLDGATSLGSGTLVAGAATLTTSALALGSHSITAVYSGDANFGGSTSTVVTEVIATNNPVPVATSLAPTFATAGDATFTLTVSGSGFVSGSVVNWNGVALTTTFVSATQLTASVPALDVVNSGTVPVTVFNPALGGGTSGALTFTINNPLPVISSMSPSSAVGGTATFTLTVNGSGFVSGSTVLWNSATRTTTFVSSTQLTVTIPSSDLLSSGSAAVKVSSPLPGGGVSVTTLTFTITVPVPVLTAIAPSSAAAGAPAFTMTLTGTTFISTSVARWNGANLTTTFVSATQLTALVPAADVLTVGTASVTVFNPVGVAQVVKTKVHPDGGGPSGQLSNALTFTINAGNPVPVPTSLSPTTTVGGGPSFTLTVNGSNFVSGSTVLWNGVARTTIFVSSTQLTATIPSSDLLSSGSAAVGVFSPLPGGGNSTTVLQFTITVPVPVLTTIAPSSAAAGAPAFTMTLTGTTFISTSVAQWNGVALATTFVNATQLTAQVPAADVLTVGTASVTVFNPAGVAQVVKAKVHPQNVAPSGQTSNALTFTINAANPTPVLGSVSPTFVTAGGAAFTLTVTGTGFVSGAIVQWNGMALVTTFVSATQLTAVVPAGDLAAAGTASVIVFNPTPGGGASNAVTENIDTVTTTTTVTVSPTPPVAGQPITFTVTIAPPPTGSSLGTVRILNGTTLLGTANVNSSGVATFTASALAAGSYSIITVYSGNATSGASSVELDITVSAGAGFSVTAPQMPFVLAQGGAVSIPIAVPPVGGAFNSAVTMSATGLPPGATASFNPAVVTPGTAGATTVLTIQLAPLHASIPLTPLAPRGPWVRQAPLAPQLPLRVFPTAPLTLALVTLGFLFTYRRPRALRLAFAAVAFAGAVILFAGCNGGFSGGQRTTAGNYIVTVTGTSGAQHVSTTVTLAVQ
jgi:YVTN family beta-propeller protein